MSSRGRKRDLSDAWTALDQVEVGKPSSKADARESYSPFAEKPGEVVAAVRGREGQPF